MLSLHALWRTLEREEVLTGVEAQWRLWLGDAIEVVRPFLKPEQALASCYPCDRNPEACARRVVHHGPDDIVAVCGLEVQECDRMPLTRADVVVYALAFPHLLTSIGVTFGCTSDAQAIIGARAWSLGVRPGGAQTFFVLPERETAYAAPLATLLAHHPTGELVVIVPTASALAAADRALLSQRRATVLACNESVEIDGDGRLVARDPSAYVIPPSEVLAFHDVTGSYGRKPVAICWRHGMDSPVNVANLDDLSQMRALEPNVAHFVDATLDKPRCSKRNGKENRDEAELTQGEVAMLLAFMARRVAGRDHERPENLRISILSTTESKKQAFKEMRRKIDRNTTSRQKYALFKARRSLDGGPQLYELRPDDGVTFCFLVRTDDLAQMRSVAAR